MTQDQRPIEIDMDQIPDEEARPWEVLVEPGTYRMEVVDVNIFHAKKDGATCVGLKLEHHGEPRFQVDDVIKLTGPSLNRLKILYKAAGLPHHGVVTLNTRDIHRQTLLVEVEERVGNNGRRQMGVTFAGYKPIDGGEAPGQAKKPEADESCPF